MWQSEELVVNCPYSMTVCFSEHSSRPEKYQTVVAGEDNRITKHHRVTGRSNGRPVHLARPRGSFTNYGGDFFEVKQGFSRFWRTIARNGQIRGFTSTARQIQTAFTLTVS